jgi:hypothetical protein
MNSLITELRNEVYAVSLEIRKLKDDETKTKPGMDLRPVTPEGEIWHGSWADRPEGTKYQNVPVEIVTDHIRPSNPRWEEYLELKRKASVAITARKIAGWLELSKDSDPGFSSIGNILKALQANESLTSHCYAKGPLATLSSMACAVAEAIQKAQKAAVEVA